jgi:hypothetical protein
MNRKTYYMISFRGMDVYPGGSCCLVLDEDHLTFQKDGTIDRITMGTATLDLRANRIEPIPTCDFTPGLYYVNDETDARCPIYGNPEQLLRSVHSMLKRVERVKDVSKERHSQDRELNSLDPQLV